MFMSALENCLNTYFLLHVGWTGVNCNNSRRSGWQPKVSEFRFKPHCVLNAGSFSLIVIDTEGVRSCRSFPFCDRFNGKKYPKLL